MFVTLDLEVGGFKRWIQVPYGFNDLVGTFLCWWHHSSRGEVGVSLLDYVIGIGRGALRMCRHHADGGRTHWANGFEFVCNAVARRLRGDCLKAVGDARSVCTPSGSVISLSYRLLECGALQTP